MNNFSNPVNPLNPMSPLSPMNPVYNSYDEEYETCLECSPAIDGEVDPMVGLGIIGGVAIILAIMLVLIIREL